MTLQCNPTTFCFKIGLINKKAQMAKGQTKASTTPLPQYHFNMQTNVYITPTGMHLIFIP